MTIIVADRRIGMACDSLIDDGGTKRYSKKIFQTPDGTILGISGAWGAGNQFVDWFMGEGDPPKMKDVQILRLDPDGTLWEYEETLRPYKIRADVEAIGSGAQGALVAIDCGCSLVESVRRACKRDSGCGGRAHFIPTPETPSGALSEPLEDPVGSMPDDQKAPEGVSKEP